MAFSMATALSLGLMEKFIEDSGRLEEWTEMEPWNGPMAADTEVNGAKAKWRARASSNSETVARTTAAIRETSKKATVFM